MTYCLDVEAVIEINRYVTEGKTVVLQQGQLESALGQPLQTFDGIDLYSTVVEKAAVLLRGVIAAHAFRDGNKRTAWLSCMTFLRLSGLRLMDLSWEVAGPFVLSVESQETSVQEAAEWLLERLEDPPLS